MVFFDRKFCVSRFDLIVGFHGDYFIAPELDSFRIAVIYPYFQVDDLVGHSLQLVFVIGLFVLVYAIASLKLLDLVLDFVFLDV